VHGNQNFTSVGGQHFHRAAGELRFVKRGTYVTVRRDPTRNGKISRRTVQTRRQRVQAVCNSLLANISDA